MINVYIRIADKLIFETAVTVIDVNVFPKSTLAQFLCACVLKLTFSILFLIKEAISRTIEPKLDFFYTHLNSLFILIQNDNKNLNLNFFFKKVYFF